ncbi:hypothetical protein [Achromobacter marplatensis]|uniref:hypothetical protein n=1 Tax=Achromobacter marplatensis TaxID=470868 RepID=UPI003C72161A
MSHTTDCTPPAELPGKKADIRTDLLTDEEFDRNCMLYADWAFYTPPEQFLFHHYEEPADELLICHRPMIGIEKYVVSGVNGGHYGVYDTRDVTKYLKTGTWVQVDNPAFFLSREVSDLERQLTEKKAEFHSTQPSKDGGGDE